MWTNVQGAMAAVALVALTANPAAAAMRARAVAGTVTACSTYGHGCTTAPVRYLNLGPQIRLKGGPWIWCESDCRDTLRRATVDFWDDQRESAK